MMPDGNFRAVKELVIVCHSHYETGHIILTFRIKIRHFSGFTPYKGAVGFLAAGGDTFYHLDGLVYIQLAHGYVIQHEQGCGPLNHDVVYAHSHQIDPDRVMAIHHECDFQFCAYAIRRGHKYRVLNILYVQGQQSGKPADIGNDP